MKEHWGFKNSVIKRLRIQNQNHLIHKELKTWLWTNYLKFMYSEKVTKLCTCNVKVSLRHPRIFTSFWYQTCKNCKVSVTAYKAMDIIETSWKSHGCSLQNPKDQGFLRIPKDHHFYPCNRFRQLDGMVYGATHKERRVSDNCKKSAREFNTCRRSFCLHVFVWRIG